MIPFILSGGSGTRLWPVSRATYPKQFCEFYDMSFMRNTLERVSSFGTPCVLTVQSMRDLTRRTYADLGLNPESIFIEPMGRNTGPAVALICYLLKSQGKLDEVVGVFPADHLVADQKTFAEVIETASSIAEKGPVVTLGIQPRRPATGYGYIQTDAPYEELSGAKHKPFQVKQFCEKPALPEAKEFVASGQHYWNSGIFVFKVSQMIENFKRLTPDLWSRIEQIKPDLSNLKQCYSNIESISIDYAVMERLEDTVCIPCEIGWSDVGSWDELARLTDEYPDLASESKANVVSEGASNNYVYSAKQKTIGLVGVSDLIIVDTPDALLVSQRGQSESVKGLVTSLKQKGIREADEHSFETRPWGKFESLAEEKDFKVKKIQVLPKERLSYQSHQHRAEHWIVISGEAKVTLDDKDEHLKTGDSIVIPVKSKHRIENTSSTEPLVFVEIQRGDYFGEDDIVRYQDDYERV